METMILIICLAIAGQTSYLLYKTLHSSGRVSKEAMLCDTSALIDGRIIEVARSGFLSSQLIVTKSVLRELQLLADKADHDKRERARFGLDIVQGLQSLSTINVMIYDDGEKTEDGVDEQLIKLAKQFGAKLCTTDYNLNKVARAEGIVVTNVNELAHAIRSVHLPGEKITVTIVAKGQGREQGVGYLDDGTMVVVDNASRFINKSVTVEVTRMLQTEAGRMLFAKPDKVASQKQTLSAKSKSKTNRRQTAAKESAEDSLVRLANKD